MNQSCILVVEDEAIVAMDIEDRLTAMGYQLGGAAASGEQALALAEAGHPDLVLMDIRLQGAMDGIVAAEEMRRRFHVPVIFLTAYSEEATLERAKLAEPYGYVLKPFNDRELKSAIEIALYKHQAEEEIRRLNRLYDVLSQVNQSVVRIELREELLSTVCRLAVERGAIDLAWIGWLDEDTSRINPVAYFGKQSQILSEADFFADDRPEGQGTPGKAIREGEPFVCNECSRDVCLYPVAKQPALFGFKSCGSFPLRFQGQVCGALNLCIVEPGFFRERETGLLTEVAMDISFALDKIEGNARREHAEAGILRQNVVLAGINRIFQEALSSHSEADLGRICLAVAEDITGSRFGFLGEISIDGRFDEVAVSGTGWEACKMGELAGHNGPASASKIHGFYGRVLKEGKGFFSNDPASHSDCIGLSPGNPPVEAFLGVPLKRDGRIVGMIGVGNRDGGYSQQELEALEAVTPAMAEAFSQKRAEQALALSRAEFEAMFNSIADAVIFADTRSQILMVNPAFIAMFGYEPDEVKGRTTEFLYTDSHGIEEQGQKRYSPGDAVEQSPFETTCVHKDGTIFFAESLSMPVRDSQRRTGFPSSYSSVPNTENVNTIGKVVTFRDITVRKRVEEERKKLEEQLFQAQKMESVGRLAGGVAHDFNNMLGVIIGAAEMALEQDITADELRQNLNEIIKAGQRSADLTRQLLAFARKQTAIPKILDLNDTIASMLKMLRRLIGEDIDLIWAPELGLWNVKIDPSQVDQILANLAVNARDAISGVGAITMRTENVVIDDSNKIEAHEFMPGEYVLLSVSDSGEGMSKEVSEKIFEPFFTTKELGKGTGLGLSTVYGIVKQNDGFIYVASVPGKGATFNIYLPRFESESAPVTCEEETGKRPTGTETILLVEDDDAILKLTKAILEKLGYTVLAAQTPVHAIHLVEEHPGDLHLLITDVVMPEMNGRELAKRLGAIRPNLKCIYMSGYTADVIAHRGIVDEGVNFIQKPFGCDDFAARVRQVLDHL
jgi:PAS domain S-box-containing protein